ncbi:MAG: hypothetical protein KTR14_04740 [Vampirovibrio sp.]|nr:hypothetical protein [Vampirovibrio sp.]
MFDVVYKTERFTQVLDHTLKVLKPLFGCGHFKTPLCEGKAFCPDCGRGVVLTWVRLRCSGCHQIRDGQYFLRRVVPASRCCTHCGDVAVTMERLESPEYVKVTRALLLIEEEEEFLQQAGHTSWAQSTAAWVDREWSQLPRLLPAS